MIKLQDEAYGLALGWKISRSSFDVVSKFVGYVDYCRPVSNTIPDDEKTNEDWQALRTALAIANNSCVLQDVEATLKLAN